MDPRFDGDDDALCRMMVDYDEALVGGLSTVPFDLAARTLDASLAEEWQTIKECLEQLDRARRAGGPPPADSEHSDTLRSSVEVARSEPRAIGRFTIQRELGRGGLGVVFLADDPKLGRQVALKVPRFEALTEMGLRRRFLREAEAAARLSHPHIVTLYEVGEDGAVCYLASEYCAGRTLGQWLHQQTLPVHARQAAAVLRDLAEAVQHAHSRGVLHRDIKPANVLLAAKSTASQTVAASLDGVTAKLTDFGMAKLLEQESHETRTGAIIGTLAYMSPEQAEGRIDELDARTDVYSLGVILYEMLVGHPPFVGSTDVATLRQMATGTIVPIRDTRKDVPRDLEAIALKCLARAPADRYATAHELAVDLQRFLSGNPTLARPLGPIEQAVKWARRRPTTAAVLTVCCCAAVALAATSTIYNARLHSALEDARHLLYVADMQAGFDTWNQSVPQVLMAKLDRYVPRRGEADLRTMPWYLLNRWAHGDQRTLGHHEGAVYAVAFSPRGTQVATAGKDAVIKVWDGVSGRSIKLLRDHKADVNDLAFSPDGRLLASCGDDKIVRIWNVDGDTEPRRLRSGGVKDLNGVDFSPDGQWLAAGGEDGWVGIWQTSSWTRAATGAKNPSAVNKLTFAHDSRSLVATRSDGTVTILDVATGNIDRTLPLPIDNPRRAGAVACSHDGKLIAAISIERQTIFLWSAETKELLRSTESDGNWMHALQFSLDDKRLYTGHRDGLIRVWNSDTLQQEQVLVGHLAEVRDLAVSGDGKRLTSGDGSGAVLLWDLDGIGQRHTVDNIPRRCKSVAFSSTANRYAVEEFSGDVRVFDALTGKQVYQTTVPRFDAQPLLAITNDGTCLAYTIEDGRSIELLNLASLEPVEHFASKSGRFHAVAFLPGDDILATGDDDSMLALRRRSSGEVFASIETGQNKILSIAFLDHGRRIATAGDQGVKVRSTQDFQQEFIFESPAGKTPCLTVSPDQRLMAGGTVTGEILIWDTTTGHVRATLAGHRSWVGSLAFSPDGQTLASASDDSTVRLWDVRTFQEIGALRREHASGELAFSVAFSPDGLTLIAGLARPGEQGALHSWSARAPSAMATAP